MDVLCVSLSSVCRLPLVKPCANNWRSRFLWNSTPSLKSFLPLLVLICKVMCLLTAVAEDWIIFCYNCPRPNHSFLVSSFKCSSLFISDISRLKCSDGWFWKRLGSKFLSNLIVPLPLLCLSPCKYILQACDLCNSSESSFLLIIVTANRSRKWRTARLWRRSRPFI